MEPQAPQVDGYVVRRHVGEGGSADVWLAERAGERLALKVFRPDCAMTGRREWRSLRRHAGAHVVPAVDFVQDSRGRSVLVMPYYSRGTLWDVVRGRGGLTSGEVITALAPIASALARIHDGGCVHGDLTPRNVLFDDDGRPLLADLGASRAVASPGASEWGSAGFSAPEVLDGESPSAESDVYSWGAVCWFALTGEGPQPPALRPRLDEVVADVPRALVEMITAALSMTPSARPHSGDLASQVLSAARPVAVPLGAAERLTNHADAGEAMTRRIRDEAQRAQLRGPAGGPRTQARAARRRRDAPQRIARLAVVACVTAALAVAVWPDSRPAHAAHRADALDGKGGAIVPAAAARVATPAPDPAVSASVSAPGEQPAPTQSENQRWRGEVGRLLDCRARAWNETDPRGLRGCLADDSSAMRSDVEALDGARSRGAHYEGVRYEITDEKLRVLSGKPEEVQLELEVRRSAYGVGVGRDVRTAQPALDRVRLTLRQSPGGWRISDWASV